VSRRGELRKGKNGFGSLDLFVEKSFMYGIMDLAFYLKERDSR